MFKVGEVVKIKDAMDVSWIGKEAKVIEVVSENPITYKLDIGGGHWLHSQFSQS